MFRGSVAIYQPQTVLARDGKTHLISFRFVGLRGRNRDEPLSGPGGKVIGLRSRKRGLSPFLALKILGIITEQAHVNLIQLIVQFKWQFQNQQIIDARFIGIKAVETGVWLGAWIKIICRYSRATGTESSALPDISPRKAWSSIIARGV